MVKVEMHCRYCNIGVFEAEVNDEPDRWVAPKAPWGWETITNPLNHSTVYKCPDCIRREEKDNKIIALVNLGRPMERGIIDQDFTDCDLENMRGWCELIQDTVGKELERRREAEPKKRGRRKNESQSQARILLRHMQE